MSRTTWPSIRFSSDESVACRMATNEVLFFDTGDFSKGFTKLRVPGVAAIELSKTPGSHVAAFVPEAKGIPASVQIFACGKDAQAQPVARKSFFRCSTVQLIWNFGSTGLLIVAQSDVDATNQSYYGESKLHYLTTNGTHEGSVPLRKEGPVHEVRWSCTGAEFAVVYGYMPAKATVFNQKCNPLLELGEGPYNTIRWNPKGRYLCLAGFGNLPGDMAFWDYKEKKLLGSTRAELSVSSEWIKIFHPNGSLLFNKMFVKLYQADWKPEAPEKFGDVPELAQAIGSLKIDEKKQSGPGQGSKSSQGAKKATIVNPVATKPAAYRPPHAKVAAAVQSELFGGGSSTEELSKNALRNKMKREKQRAKKAAEGGA
ncbi:hypothetical protein MKX01_020725 [Papaver californicum]|nr:hypothetical protein MKX01_020725 [Papaver californicum]